MLSAVHFRNFKALRSAAVRLAPCNLLIGPSGSGKTSLIQALLRLRTLAALPVTQARDLPSQSLDGPQIVFHFAPPYESVRVTLGCQADELVCNLLVVDHAPGLPGEAQWGELRLRLQRIRAFLLDHYAMAVPAKRTESRELASNGSNLAAVLAAQRTGNAEAFARLEADFCRIMPEFAGLSFADLSGERVELRARLAESAESVPAESLSQGTLYLLGLLALAHDPQPPQMVCLEEADRGMHPRMLREVRDLLYRLAYPESAGSPQAPAQVIATTHSPYLLDLFRDHPEEVILAHKEGNAATFERLSERADILELMKEANLGDLWYSGVLGSVPAE